MLEWLIFMADKIDNTEAIQETVAGRAQQRDVTSLLRADPGVSLVTSHSPLATEFVTLGDGHTVPSENAVTPAASTKLENLMDTLSRGFERRFS